MPSEVNEFVPAEAYPPEQVSPEDMPVPEIASRVIVLESTVEELRQCVARLLHLVGGQS